MTTLTGQIIRGYQVEEQIGEGGFGAVYRARQAVVNRTVAIKAIWSELADEPEFIRNFESEAKIIASLEHPQIVPLYDYWREPSGAFLVMRLLRGGNLRTALAKNPHYSGEEAAFLLGQIAGAAMLAHRYGIVHRDIKPENILLDEEGNYYLGDFGIAQSFGNPIENSGLLGAGSPAYASPEQLLGVALTPQSDQYSLAIILYEALAGAHPMPELSKLTYTELVQRRSTEPLPHITKARPDLPKELNTVLARATHLDPIQRYPDMLAFAKAFREALTFRAVQQAEATLFANSDTSRLLNKTPNGTIRTPNGTSYVDSLLPAVLDPVVNPYKGLRTFEEADTDAFYGRELLTEYLVNRLAEKSLLSRFLAVVGPSGSGKSSLVKAGLIPALKRGALPGSKQWFIVLITPGTHPLDELEVALLRIATTTQLNVREQIERDERGLIRILKLVLPPDGELLLVIDQFEEVFTHSVNEASTTHLLNNLYAAVTDSTSRFRLVITLRADFYDRPLMYANFGNLLRERTEIVVPMNSEEMERAIVAPAKQVGVSFESGLVSTIISEVSGQLGSLPLLQYGLSELFDQHQGNRITFADYRAIGGVLGALGRKAEDIFNSFGANEQQLIRQLFLRLVTLGEGTEDTRRRVLLSEVASLNPAHITPIVDMFSKARLLTYDRDPHTRTPTIEVAHEAILREWSRLRGWLDASRSDVRLQRTLAALATDWMKADRDASFLLRGARLEQFEHWYSSANITLTQEEQAFLTASIQERQAQHASEKTRLANEAALEQRAKIRLRLLVAILLLATVGTTILSAVALNGRMQAQANADLSRNLAVIANAQAARNAGDPDLALALAMEVTQAETVPPEAQQLLSQIASGPGTRRMFRGGHLATVQEVIFSRDGRTALTCSRDHTIILWDMETGAVIRTFRGHTDHVGTITISPDEQILVSVSADSTAIVWDVDSGQALHTFRSDTPLKAVAFHPVQPFVAFGSAEGVLTIWNIETQEVVRTWQKPVDASSGPSRALTGAQSNSIETVAFSPDGNILVSGSPDATLTMWDANTGQAKFILRGHKGDIERAAYSSDGRLIASSSRDATVILWNTATGEQHHVLEGHTAFVNDVAFSPSGRTVVSAGLDNRLILWDAETGNNLRSLQALTSVAYSVAFSPDERNLLVGYGDGTLRLWDLYGEGELRRYSDVDSGFWRVAYSPDGSKVISATGPKDTSSIQLFGNQILLLDAESGQVIRSLQGQFGIITSLSFSPDGTQAVSSALDGTLVVWDVETGDIVRTFRSGIGFMFGSAFSPDGRFVVGGSSNDTLTMWSIETGEIIHTFNDHTDDVITVRFSPDGRTMLSGADNGIVILWDVETAKPIYTLVGHGGSVLELDYSPDGKTAVTSSEDSRVILWNLETGTAEFTFEGHTGIVPTVDYSPDGTMLLSASEGGSIILWDVETREIIRRYEGHFGHVSGVSFSPDGLTAVSASLDGSVRMWRVSKSVSLPWLVEWLQTNRYVSELTCKQRIQYRLGQDSSCN
jgi:WD40 repeat protein/serine/threonine protein kinase